jgi:hypothetical protein
MQGEIAGAMVASTDRGGRDAHDPVFVGSTM